ncbi:MAG: hypothetical protein LiPW41_37 [Parcubacteria group bacterium LiPW_41]|nr:MAG: hypothetical protein LiPW41_37 [Parcubacteria group bacterium LiPW_41]
MEKVGKIKKEMLFAGHLDEIDDLKKYGRDAPLIENEKNRNDLEKIVDAIVSRIEKADKGAVLLISSSKIRAIETAHLVGGELKRRLGEKIKIRYSSDEGLRAPDQGELILPEDYTSGSFFEGLKIASSIFYEESLNPSNKNLHYKFGDPLLQENGEFKYPLLSKCFKSSGETYAESLSRILKLVEKMAQKVGKLDSSTEVVLVAHGFTYQILRGLSVLAEQIKNGEVTLKTGDIPSRLSEIYEKRTGELRDSMCVPLDITNLGDKELLDVLEKEINFLDNKNTN